MAALTVYSLACSDASAADRVLFDQDIRPILAGKCFKCHGPFAPQADLSLTSRQAALESGAVIPGDAASSPLIERVSSADRELRMPPEGEPLTPRERQLLRDWIDQGADWPEHWAWRPLVKPPLPELRTESMRKWAKNPIDLFIGAKLEAAGLSPSPEAEAATLHSRLSYDLLGLPFGGDGIGGNVPWSVGDAPSAPGDAHERLVDALLASPHQGERAARRWMDVVHFAETHGHDQDRPREHAWPYRDYLIRSFNSDKPYSRFIEEQVAGDVLYPLESEAVIATGLLAAGPWDESSLRDIREDSLDREIGRYLDRDDIVSTVMQTFASSSVHCARCHDHKFDPISQDEYYALQAVFSGIDKANRPFDPDPQTARRRQALEQEKAEVARMLAAGDVVLASEERKGQVARWEEELKVRHIQWRPLESVLVSSQHGVRFESLADGSFRASGERPDRDTYTVIGRAPLARVTAVRLELLTDDALPMKGPGWQDNGNLHLNEVAVYRQAKSAANGADSHGEAAAIWNRVVVAEARADFNQEGWTVAAAIDGNADSAWGIFPQVGKPHHAVFSLASPAPSREAGEPGGGESGGKAETSPGEQVSLKIELAQIHGRGHLIGRFRLLVTDFPLPLPAEESTLPENIGALLAVDPAQRSDQDWRELSAYMQTDLLEQQLRLLPPQAMVYSGTPTFKPDGSFKPAGAPRTVHVLNRGLVTEPLRPASPGALNCVAGAPGDLSRYGPLETDSARRIALARWLSDPGNALVWRSIVNRLWQHYFGRALVDTPNDFGLMGGSPTHPELLDWLAATLVENGGSLKAITRLLVTSAAYRQSCRHNEASAAIDQDNRWLWRMNRRRLDAESFHDALLVLSGTLDSTMGGPSVRQFIQTPGVHVTPNVDYLSFSSEDPANHRRSVYRFLFRTLPDPLMDALDCPDASQLTPQRTESVTALQALATLNDKFVVRQGEYLGELVQRQAQDDLGRAQAAFQRVFGRSPTDEEAKATAAYASRHGWANACRFLVNSSEFLFVE